MKILLIYPKCQDSFWGFKYALRFLPFKKAPNPPLGLLTVAAMLPEKWKKKLIDMNVEKLRDQDLGWADYVFISGISIQKESIKEIILRCQKIGAKIVAGGPLFTTGYKEFEKDIDHILLYEAEITLPRFLHDLGKRCAKKIYAPEQKADSDKWANIEKTPIPLWELINMKQYVSMGIQYSRGCPFNCEFCDITVLNGRKLRTKSKNQVIAELERLYAQGWKEGVFFVDDNFIGNREKLKQEILPAITAWQKKRKHPFAFITQASINLVDDEELMEMMVVAGFNTVFVGIETPNEESLSECGKFQNKGRDLVACVKKIQKFLQVQGGFIVGFDSDPPSIFEKQIEFIQESRIATAMVGLLNVPRDTRLYDRLNKQKRILKDVSGDNTDFSINFIPRMDRETLINGFRKILSKIYSPKLYYERVQEFLKEYRPLQKRAFHCNFSHIGTLGISMLLLGVIGKERLHYWKLFFWSLFKHPRLFPLAITFAIYGFHFRKIFELYKP